MTHKDPLHIPYEQLTVVHKGKEVLILNKRLLDQQNCWKNLDLIKSLHQQRLIIEDEMADIDSFLDLPDHIRQLTTRWTETQFDLQEAWGFPKDAKYHRWWSVPSCKCPKMDNEDSWPSGYSVRSGDCPLHGEGV